MFRGSPFCCFNTAVELPLLLLSGALTIVAACKGTLESEVAAAAAARWDAKELDEVGEGNKGASVSVELGKKKM
jgi:hypothetical protein